MTIKFRVSDPVGELGNFKLPKWVLKDRAVFDNEAVGRAIARKNRWHCVDIYYIDDSVSIVCFERCGVQIGSSAVHFDCE